MANMSCPLHTADHLKPGKATFWHHTVNNAYICFSHHTVNKHSLYGVPRPTFLSFASVVLLFKIAPKHNAAMLSRVHMWKNNVVCLMKKTSVMGKFHSDVKLQCCWLWVQCQWIKNIFKKVSLNKNTQNKVTIGQLTKIRPEVHRNLVSCTYPRSKDTNFGNSASTVTSRHRTIVNNKIQLLRIYLQTLPKTKIL